MFHIRKQIRNLYAVSALSSFQIAGASWVALLAARGFSLVERVQDMPVVSLQQQLMV